MSYLRFDRTLLTNLERSLNKEMLATNRAGAYSSTTIIDCNTRKYHGLLVVPIPEMDDDNHVLLSSCDETVIQHGAEFNIGIHKYSGDYYSPRGHKYIREFRYGAIATTVYRIGGVVLQKERLLVAEENRLLVAYTLLDAHSATTLCLRPFLAFRNVNTLTRKNGNANTSWQNVENGVSFCLYGGYPDLVMQTNKQSQWVSNPDWYLGVEYAKEAERGYDFKEDLFVPGCFEMSIKKGETIIFSAGTEATNTRNLKRLFEKEKAGRIDRTDFLSCLRKSADQFINKKPSGWYINAGYPWFKYRARDQFIALPGITLATDREDVFNDVMEKSRVAIRECMDGSQPSTLLRGIDMPDAMLWAIWAVQQYAIKYGVEKAAAQYLDFVTDIIAYIRHQRHPNLFVHDNGLLYTHGKDVPVTWMNAVENGRPITPRSGYVVEINALWFNALKFASQLCQASGQTNLADMYNYHAEFNGRSFVDKFWNGNYLYDYCDENESNREVRPNMIFAVSLPFSPLDLKQKKAIVDTVTRELLTIKGLRSLSPQSGMYRPFYVGSQLDRNRNYHNGPVWPWTIAAFIEAYLKVYKMSGLSFALRAMAGLEPEMKELTLGTLSELYDGNPTFRGHGAMSFAVTVAEVLRAMSMIGDLKTVMSEKMKY